MPPKPAEQDAKQAPDLLLLTNLKRAKSRQMFFVVVAKGTGNGKLILARVPVKPAAVAAARKEFKGGRVFRGTCSVQAGKHVFELDRAPPATLARLIKQLAKLRTGLVIRPICRVAVATDDKK